MQVHRVELLRAPRSGAPRGAKHGGSRGRERGEDGREGERSLRRGAPWRRSGERRGDDGLQARQQEMGRARR
eukprot:408216-Rhodomonas_salina.6